MKQNKYVIGLVCFTLALSGCSAMDISEETQATVSGETAISIQMVTETTEATTVEETTEEVVSEQIWTYSNFDGVDLSGENFAFAQRKKIKGEEAANEFIESFVINYNAGSPVCLFEAGEYSAYEYTADGGSVFVYIDNLGLDPAYMPKSEESAEETAETSEVSETENEVEESAESTEDTEGTEGSELDTEMSSETVNSDLSDAERIVECYYIDYSKITTLGNIPQSCEDACWDRMAMTSGIETVIDRWNTEAPSDYVPDVVNGYTVVDYNLTPNDDGTTSSNGKIFMDDMGRPVFVRYYLNSGNSSEMFFYNDAGDTIACLKFSGIPYKDMGDYDEGLILTAYFFCIDKPEPGYLASK
ncbi:MAG: hypothetical protein MJ153_07255 [Clostridia bacterium]|nr:hypothetical protein [Clostridia bacterium]